MSRSALAAVCNIVPGFMRLRLLLLASVVGAVFLGVGRAVGLAGAATAPAESAANLVARMASLH